jgi:hypothetical protein
VAERERDREIYFVFYTCGYLANELKFSVLFNWSVVTFQQIYFVLFHIAVLALN